MSSQVIRTKLNIGEAFLIALWVLIYTRSILDKGPKTRLAGNYRLEKIALKTDILFLANAGCPLGCFEY